MFSVQCSDGDGERERTTKEEKKKTEAAQCIDIHSDIEFYYYHFQFLFFVLLLFICSFKKYYLVRGLRIGSLFFVYKISMLAGFIIKFLLLCVQCPN